MNHSLIACLLLLSTTTLLAEEPPASPAPGGFEEVILEGIAQDPEGLPLSGVEVSISAVNEPGEGLYQRTTTAADGRFRFEGVSIQYRWILQLEHPQYINTSVPLYRLPPKDPLIVTFAPGASVSGRVLDEDGQPVAGVRPRVTIRQKSSSGSSYTSFYATETGEDGTFQAAGIDVGIMGLEVRGKGFMEAAKSFEIRGLEHLEGVEIILQRGHSLTGQVIDAAGEPVPEAPVRAETSRGSDPEITRFATADSEGRFVLENLPLGDLSLLTKHPEKGIAQKDLQLTAQLEEVELRLQPRPTIRGRILEEATGSPLADADVDLLGDWGMQSISTGKDGSFRIHPQHPGPFRLRASHPGFLTYEAELEGDATATEHVLQLNRGLRLTGTVLGAKAQDLPYLEIRARPAGRKPLLSSPQATARATAEGGIEYELAGLYPEEWDVWITMEGSARQGNGKVTIPQGSKDPTYDLPLSTSTLTLSGQIRVNGEPVPSVRIFPSATETDHEGRFIIEGLEPGFFAVIAHGPWGTVERQGEIYADKELLIDLEAYEVSLQVFLPDGQPAAEAQVFLRGTHGESTNGTGMSQQTNAEGRLWLPTILAGKYQLTAFKEGFGPANHEFELRSDQRNLEFFLEKPTALSLQIRQQNGQSVRQVEVVAFDDAGQIAGGGEISLDAEGRGTIESLSAGNWTLMVFHEGSAFSSLPIQVPGDTVQIELEPATHLRVVVPELQESKAQGELEIFDAEGQALTPQVMGRPGERWPLWAGAFELPILPAGTWTLRATGGQGQTWEGTVTTHPDAPAEVVLQ